MDAINSNPLRLGRKGGSTVSLNNIKAGVKLNDINALIFKKFDKNDNEILL